MVVEALATLNDALSCWRERAIEEASRLYKLALTQASNALHCDAGRSHAVARVVLRYAQEKFRAAHSMPPGSAPPVFSPPVGPIHECTRCTSDDCLCAIALHKQVREGADVAVP